MASSNNNEIVADISPFIKVYKNGTIERMIPSPFVPPSPHDQTTGVSSKDLKITEEVLARLYLPVDIKDSRQEKLPILVYFHCGGFCLESAFSIVHQRYVNVLASSARVLVISVEYRLAPEHPLPAAYDDSWAALQWVASHAIYNSGTDKEPWLINYGNFDKIYIGGDSSGANIVHNIAIRAGGESLSGDLRILGAFLTHPFFLGSDLDSTRKEYKWVSGFWMLAHPSADGGIDNPMVNPFADDAAPSLSRLGCSKMLVIVAEKDFLRDKGILYSEAVKKSGWQGVIELIEIKGEVHSFQMVNPDAENAKILIKHLASFLA